MSQVAELEYQLLTPDTEDPDHSDPEQTPPKIIVHKDFKKPPPLRTPARLPPINKRPPQTTAKKYVGF
jgi:hypothetical protein